MDFFDIVKSNFKLSVMSIYDTYPLYKIKNTNEPYNEIKDLESILFNMKSIHGYFSLSLTEMADMELSYKLVHPTGKLLECRYTLPIREYERMAYSRVEILMREISRRFKLEILLNNVLGYIEECEDRDTNNMNMEWVIAKEMNNYLETGELRLPIHWEEMNKLMKSYYEQYNGNILLFT